jgi:hypothetical protein
MITLPEDILELIFEESDVITKAQMAVTCRHWRNRWINDWKGIFYQLKFRMNPITKELKMTQEASKWTYSNLVQPGKWTEITHRWKDSYDSEFNYGIADYFGIVGYLENSYEHYTNRTHKMNLEIYYAAGPNQLKPLISLTKTVQRHIKEIKIPKRL